MINAKALEGMISALILFGIAAGATIVLVLWGIGYGVYCLLQHLQWVT